MRIQVSLAVIGLIFATTLGTIAATQAISRNQSGGMQNNSGSELAYRGSGRMES